MVRGLTRTARAATSVVIQPESPDMSASSGRDWPRVGSSAIEGYLTLIRPLAARLRATSRLWGQQEGLEAFVRARFRSSPTPQDGATRIIIMLLPKMPDKRGDPGGEVA